MNGERWLLVGAGIIIIYLWVTRQSGCTAQVTSTFTPLGIANIPGGVVSPGSNPLAANGSDAQCQTLLGQGNAYFDPIAGYCLVTPA